VFKCPSENAKNILVDFYRYVEHIVGVNSVHFLIRDRIDDEVVFSFRILIESADKTRVDDVIALKLQNSFPKGRFAINPRPKHSLYRYVAWPWRDRIHKDGPETFSLFCHYLTQVSRIVVEMAEEDYFDSQKRVEMVHVMCWMLGCREYGLLSTKDMQVGYYDRIEGKYHHYLKHVFKQQS
jgi:hypothetical protein